MKVIQYMRFRKARPSQHTHTYMDLKHIAKFLRKSVPYVSKKCKALVEDYKRQLSNKKEPRSL